MGNTIHGFGRGRARGRLAIGLLWAAVAAPGALFAQGRSDGLPSAKEMEDGLRMMREQMQALPPEQRKMIEQQMGQMAAAAAPAADDALVPKRDAARIAKVPKKPSSGAELKAYVEQLQPKIAQALEPKHRQRAQYIEAELRKQPEPVQQLRAAVNGLALIGAWAEATYLAGRVAAATGNAQDLSNLAALLVMQRAGQAAIPILQVLDQRYPNNSTVLNNLGQAWFELGEEKEAERFLGAAVKRSPTHPQANMTRSRLQEARGDKAAAAESVRKSIQGGFSEAKAQRLEQLGGKLKREDLRWTLHMPQDPLGLEKFELPKYPKKALEIPEAIPAWKAFRESTFERVAALEQQSRKLGTQSATAGAAGQLVEGPLGAKARRVGQFDAEVAKVWVERAGRAKADAIKAEAEARQKLDKAISQIDAEGERQYRNKPGGYQRDYTCDKVLPLVDEYLNASNARFEQADREWLEGWSRQINNAAYMAQFQMSPAAFEAAKAGFQLQYMQFLNGVHAALYDKFLLDRAVCLTAKKEMKKASAKLPDFDVMNCKRIYSFTIPKFLGHTVRCNVSETKIDAGFIKAGYSEDLAKGRWLNASAEIDAKGVGVSGHGEFDDKGLASGGVRASAGGGVAAPVGPLEIGVAMGASAGAEFDRNGFRRGGVDAAVGVAAKTVVGPTTATADVAVSGGFEFDANGITDARTDIAAHGSVVVKGSAEVLGGKVEHTTSVEGRWSYNAGYTGSSSIGVKPSGFF